MDFFAGLQVAYDLKEVVRTRVALRPEHAHKAFGRYVEDGHITPDNNLPRMPFGHLLNKITSPSNSVRFFTRWQQRRPLPHGPVGRTAGLSQPQGRRGPED